MSLQSWMGEFMPVPASHAVTSELEAVQHSLQKWRGLTKENLKKHGVSQLDVPAPGSANCSLCLRHCGGCSTCSLYKSRGNVPCDDQIDGEEDCSPYHAYTGTWFNKKKTPIPMIKCLEQTERDIIEGKLDL